MMDAGSPVWRKRSRAAFGRSEPRTNFAVHFSSRSADDLESRESIEEGVPVSSSILGGLLSAAFYDARISRSGSRIAE